MIRLLVIVAVLSALCRWAFGKWPWDYLKAAQTREQAVLRARKLLGISAHADARQIREAHRRLSAESHPDRGGSHGNQSDLNAARDLLLSELPNDPESPQ